MKYSISRTINLGKFGIPYESITLHVEDAESWKEAEAEIQQEIRVLHDKLTPLAQKRYEQLIKKQKLTMTEEKEREALKKTLTIPF